MNTVPILLLIALSLAMAAFFFVGLFLVREGWRFGVFTGIASSAAGIAACATSIAYFGLLASAML
jgi:hypothetical protein